MITVRNLNKTFPPDTQALSQISFQVDKGDFIGVIGGSGSGKSTLLRCIGLKEKWTSGQLIYEGRDITSSSWTDRLKLGKDFVYLEEKPRLNRNQTALRNVLKGRVYHTSMLRLLTGTVNRDEHVLGMDYLEKVGLLDKGHMKVSDLSGGEQQRVAIAKALVQGARLLVIDEPVTGLDPKSVEFIMNDLRSLCKDHQLTVIAAMHQVELAQRFASRIWGISGGEMMLDIAARSITLQEKKLIFGSL
jgi:phosphonate transport system ATP-binding protein